MRVGIDNGSRDFHGWCMPMIAPKPNRGLSMPSQLGFTLIEILVTMALILLGLLGTIGLQTRASNVELESYQRGEALSLAREMQARLTDSRGIVSGYLDSSVSSIDGTVYVGAQSPGTAVSYTDASGQCVAGGGVPLAQAQYEMCQWGLALQGSAVKNEGGSNIGAMIGARGCLIRVVPPENNAKADIFVVIVWQGVAQGTEPAVDSPAGQNWCAKDVTFPTGLRRGVSVRVLVPDLTKAT